MKKTFKPGKKFKTLKALAVVANIIVVITFYFIYNFMLTGAVGEFGGSLLTVVFVIIAVVVAKLTLVVGNLYERSLTYTITKNELIIGEGRNERRYKWSNFKSVTLKTFALKGILPLVFQVDDETIELNHYTQDIYGLAQGIFNNISKYVEIDEEIKSHVKTMQGTF